MVGRLVNLGALRRNPKRPASVRTVANYRDCLLQIARRIAAEGRELRDLTPETAIDYLRTRTADLGQKALDMHRQALQAMLVHVSRRLPEGERLTVLRSRKPRRTGGRAYGPEQIRMVAAAQNARNGLSTLIAHAAGLRAHELLTLARPGEQPPDRRPARSEKFAGRPGRNYTVIGKGGLVRLVRLPDHLADRLEERRREGRGASPTAASTTPPATTSPAAPLGASVLAAPRNARSAGPPVPMALVIRMPKNGWTNCSASWSAPTPWRP